MATVSSAVWRSTQLRIKHLAEVEFYQSKFGMTLAGTIEKPGVSHFFLHTPPGETKLELVHYHGSESDDSLVINNGNIEPHRNFGHICFSTEDVNTSCETLDKAEVAFKKKPDEGRMKGLAFALSPDTYWIEIIKRSHIEEFAGEYMLNQTMIRIKDPVKSLGFYKALGLTVLAERHFEAAAFSLYFLGHAPEGAPITEAEGSAVPSSDRREPILELTHNHGTEKDDGFSYYDPTAAPRGFGNLTFVVPDIALATAALEAAGAKSTTASFDGLTGGTGVLDPDGYPVQLLTADVSYDASPAP